MLKFVQGNLLQAKADYIVQQCNCLTVKSRGLSKQIADTFPFADVYAKRRPQGRRNLAIAEDRSHPGTIEITQHVVALYAQWRPGNTHSPFWKRYPESDPVETREQRELWFQECLGELEESCKGQQVSIAFPHGIGCGLAGGNWNHYLKFIEDFSARNDHIEVIIVKLPDGQ